MIESDVEKYLVKQCKLHDYMCYKFISPSQNGIPDRIIIGNGHTIFIETKAPKKGLRKLQEHVVARMRQHGAYVFVIDTKEKVDSFFNQITNGDVNAIQL